MAAREKPTSPIDSFIELIAKYPKDDEMRKEMLAAIKSEQKHRFRVELFGILIGVLNTLLAVGIFGFVVVTASDLSRNPDAAPQVWRVLLSATAFSTALIGGSALSYRAQRLKGKGKP